MTKRISGGRGPVERAKLAAGGKFLATEGSEPLYCREETNCNVNHRYIIHKYVYIVNVIARQSSRPAGTSGHWGRCAGMRNMSDRARQAIALHSSLSLLGAFYVLHVPHVPGRHAILFKKPSEYRLIRVRDHEDAAMALLGVKAE